MRTPLSKWIVAVCALAVVVVLSKHLSARSGALTFTLVDAITGAPLTNAHIYPVQLWSDLPVEKLRIGLSPFRHFAIQSSNNVFKILDVSRQNRFKFSVAFVAPGYQDCTFDRGISDLLLYEASQDRVALPRTNQFRVPLKPKPVWRRSSVGTDGRVLSWESITNGIGIRFGR
jgi:hypothetical protein